MKLFLQSLGVDYVEPYQPFPWEQYGIPRAENTHKTRIEKIVIHQESGRTIELSMEELKKVMQRRIK